MIKKKTFVSQIALLVIFISAMSCTSLRTVTPAPAVILPMVKPKDNVQVLLTDGTFIKRMKVDTIDSGSIVGTSNKLIKTISINEIRGIQRLQDSKLYVVRIQSTIHLRLKNGETIERMKVNAIDSENIAGIVNRIWNEGHVVYITREIKMSEIASIQLEVPAPEKTMGLVVGLAIPTLLIIAGATSDFHWPKSN